MKSGGEVSKNRSPEQHSLINGAQCSISQLPFQTADVEALEEADIKQKENENTIPQEIGTR